MMNTPCLELKNVTFVYPGESSFFLECTHFKIDRGEHVLLLGESGGGKSTFLSLICGILSAQTGTIAIQGTDLTELKPKERDSFRAENIGVIFQQFNLFPFARVLDNILVSLSFAPKRSQRCGSPHEEAIRLCQELELPQNLLKEPANRLSVGQQQRVAVARAMIGSPLLIIADEPTSALDRKIQQSFLDLMFSQIEETQASLLMVSHDEELGARFNRVVPLETIVTTGKKA